MKSNFRLFDVLTSGVVVISLIFLTHWLDPIIFPLIAKVTNHRIQTSWPGLIEKAALAGLVGMFVIWLIVRKESKLSKWLMSLPAQGFQYLVSLRNKDSFTVAGPRPWRATWKDGIILLSFLFYGLLLYLSAIQGSYPNPILASDTANIASFAAAVENPDLFKNDELLSNSENLKSYSTINIPIINVLKRWTGNYGLAFAALIPIQTFINLTGFYLLGMVIIGSRVWAGLLTCMLAFPFEINLLETWGIRLDPVSRFTFQAVLPFILALAIHWRGNPQRWPWLAASSGILAFIHPVSTPVWAFAIWLGLWAFIPREWTTRKRWLVMIGLGMITVISLFPYATNYLGGHIQAEKPDYEILMKTINEDFPKNILNIPEAFIDFLEITWSKGLLPAALFFGGLLLIFKLEDRWKLNLILLWAGGILFVSLIVPWVEHAIEARYQIAPLETEIVRGLRYMILIMILLSVWGAYELFRRLKGARQWVFVGIVVILSIGWGINSDFRVLRLNQLTDCFKQGKLVCAEVSDDMRVIQAVHDLTPPGSAIFTTFSNDSKMSFSLPIRYEAQRSLVYSYKDRGQLVISNSPMLDRWAERRKIVDSINREQLSPIEKIIRFREKVLDWQTDYILTDFQIDKNLLETAGMQVVYQNDGYMLVRIR